MRATRLAIGLAAAAACLGAAVPAATGAPTTERASTNADPASTVSVSHRAGVNPVTAARNATRQYRDFRNAKAHGYGLLHDVNGVACIAMPGMGAMGIHFVNGGLVGDGKVRLKQPEAVVYARENGHRRLVALEYVVLRKDWERSHGANAHRPWLYGHRFNLTHAGNRYGLPPFYSLHAWIWKDNPAGRFAMWNPDVQCSCC